MSNTSKGAAATKPSGNWMTLQKVRICTLMYGKRPSLVKVIAEIEIDANVGILWPQRRDEGITKPSCNNQQS